MEFVLTTIGPDGPEYTTGTLETCRKDELTEGPVNVIEGRPQRRAADPLPCTKSVLQSHSAPPATANNRRT